MIHWTPLDGALQVIGSQPQVLDKLLSTNRWIDKAHQQSTHDYLRYYVSAHQRDWVKLLDVSRSSWDSSL